MKLKRKGLQDVSDDFSDFSLSSPARKIRRLIVFLPPIPEEEEFEVPLTPEQSLPQQQRFTSDRSGSLNIEELPNVPEKEERVTLIPLLQSPSNCSLSIKPNLISGLKMSQSKSWKLANRARAGSEDCSSSRVAVVRSVPKPGKLPSEVGNCEMTDAKNMDVEDIHKNGGTSSGEGLYHWQQQHCLIPQPPCNTVTPIFGFR